MAQAKVQKIQLIAASQHREKILEILQQCGAVEIREQIKEQKVNNEEPQIKASATSSSKDKELQKIELDHANVSFAIKFIKNYEGKTSIFGQQIILTNEEVEEKTKKSNYHKIAEECLDLEDQIVKAKNAISGCESELQTLKNWKNLQIPLENLAGTASTEILLGTMKTNLFTQADNEIINSNRLVSIQIVQKDDIDTNFYIIFNKESKKEIREILSKYKFNEAEFPEAQGMTEEYMKKLHEKIIENKNHIEKTEKEATKFVKNLEELKIVHDYLAWQKEKLEATKNLDHTDYNFVITGWTPAHTMEELTELLENEISEFMIAELKPEKDEIPPVIIKNNKFMEPFESVTKVYGLPLYNELDPTPFHAAFFILFFALCLTDAGYGIIMFITMALILKYFKLPVETAKLVRVLMYGGIATFIVGALFGGWFGLEADSVAKYAEFLTYKTTEGHTQFIFQKFNSLVDPLSILILALSLGILQILLGTYMKLIHGIKYGDKKEAILDTGPWAFMLTSITFAIVVAAGLLPAYLGVVAKWTTILAAISLILTQGRDKSSIIGKLMSGILSLYGLVGYLSDVLSYSRLLALGLATAIIGLAVNIIAALVGGLPWVGWLFAIVIFIGGHIFNLLINALGSFIHSGRLQFVEFFGKFMEGGGAEFKPLSKKSKYIFLKN